MEQMYFAAYHKEKAITKSSSSGGAFSAITDEWFAEHGETAIVYGCILDEKLQAKHIRVDSPEKIEPMRGSKYIGSNLTGVFLQVEEDLKANRFVAFSGTPCQIAGMNTYLAAKRVNPNGHLLTIEVICHGVGSSRFFGDYIRHLEKRYKGNAVKCNFRTKKHPGKKQDMTVWFDNGRKYYASSTKFDWFYSAYLKNLIIRPSCFKCKYAQRERFADISVADHWGDSAGDMHARSLIIANTEVGAQWIWLALQNMEYDRISYSDVTQPHMQAPCEKPDEYTKFWTIYRNEGYLAAQRMIGNNTVKGKLYSIAAFCLDRTGTITLAKRIREAIRKIRGK